MRPAIVYRIASVLLVLFAAGHQLGFRTVDPRWRADDLARAMQTTRFTVDGFNRTYWDFYSGFGFFTTVFMLFSALLAWELARVSPEVRRHLVPARWGFAACYTAIAVLTWSYFFVVPGVFATLIAVAVTLGAIPERTA